MEFPRGVKLTKNSSGHQVLWLHYSADPAKDPATSAGKRWVDAEKKRIMADINPQKWRAEYEMDFNAGVGDLVFPTLMRDKPKLTFDTIKLDDSFVYYGGLDWGTKNNTAFTIVAEDPAGRFYTVFEKTWRTAPPLVVATDIKSHPLYQQLQLIACDPSVQSHIVWNAQGHTTVAEMLSSREHVGEAALDRLMASHGRLDSVFINLIRNMWVVDPPRWTISRDCPELITELTNLSHPEQKDANNAKEKIQDRDNHLWDATKYIFLSHPRAGKPKKEPLQPGTFDYLNEIERIAAETASEQGVSADEMTVRLYGMSL